MQCNPLEMNSLEGSWQTVQNKSCISVVVLHVFQSYRLSSPGIGTCRHKALHAFTKCTCRTKRQKKNVQFKNGEIRFPLKFLCFRGFVSHKVSLNKHVFLRLMFLLYFDSLSNINPVLKRSALKVIRYSHFVLPLVKILSWLKKV